MRSIRLVGLIIILVLNAKCSRFQRIRKHGDLQTKYEAAVEYYKAKDYYRSTQLFENILPIIRGTAEAELSSFYIAYCYFYQKQYILSAHHFQEFVTIYGRSEYVPEASYMHAYSLYKQSPDYRLDQTVTYEALTAMQRFINRYPYSDYAPEADRVIDEMQVKLERKAYERCKLYYKLKSYKSALVVYDNFKDDFPDSKYQEEVAYLKIETAHDYATESVFSKQEERFTTTVDFYLDFLDRFPNSEYLPGAEKIYANCIEKLTNIASPIR